MAIYRGKQNLCSEMKFEYALWAQEQGMSAKLRIQKV